jgi:hypothetical protein
VESQKKRLFSKACVSFWQFLDLREHAREDLESQVFLVA